MSSHHPQAQRPVLVVGATGMLGRPVAAGLLSAGYKVRVLSRDPARARALLGDGMEFVGGDVRDRAALERALEGCQGVHLNLRGTTAAEAEQVEVDGAEAVAQAAKRSDVERITYLSGAGIEAADPSLLPVRIKRAAEQAIRAGGVPWTILRATHFMESLDLFVRGRTATIFGRQPQRFHYLAASDYARQVAAAYRAGQAANRELTLLGPEAFTMEEALLRFLPVVHPGVKLKQVPLAIPRLIARLTRNPDFQMVITLFAAFRQIPETGDHEAADRIVGPATTNLMEWCQRRVAGP